LTDTKHPEGFSTNHLTDIQFNSIQFYCKIGMTERSQWTEYKMNNQIYKQRTANCHEETFTWHVHAHTAQ